MTSTLSDDALRLAAEMRAGLEGVTAGEWYWVEDRWRGGYSGLMSSDNNPVLFANSANDGDTGAAWFEDFPSDADRLHIQRCHPSNIRLLLDTIDTLRRERDEALADRSLFHDQMLKHYAARASASATIAAQAAEIARKDAALKAVEDWWLSEGINGASGAPYAILAARAALQPTETPPAISEDEKMRDFFGGSFMGHPPESTETPATVAGGARSEEEVRGIDWLWYSEDAAGQHVTFGRWPKSPGAVRFKRAEIQPTEHDPPTLTQSGAGEPVVKALREAAAKVVSEGRIASGGIRRPAKWIQVPSDVFASLSAALAQEPRHDR